MNYLADRIIKHKKLVLVVFIIAIIISVSLSKLVSVNYDLVKYLPEHVPSTTALDVMNGEFTKAPPNARVLVTEVTIPQAMKYKEQISAVEGVTEVNWLDDMVNIYQPLAAIDKKTIDSFYKDNSALFTIVVDEEQSKEAVEKLEAIIGDKGELTGEIIDQVTAQTATGAQTGIMMLLIVPIILIILFITTSSWFEPILFMIVIGVAIVINDGTNAFLGEISFVTKASSAILQLAVSMDYSIFLLHRFSEFRQQGQDVKSAIKNAMQKSFPSISASGFTTVIGFGALIIMRFKIGTDLGLVLAKGIIFSMLSIMLLLPVLTIYTYKLIDKTHHRSFLPSFDKFGRFAIKIGIPVIIIVLIAVSPAFLAQRKNDFLYGAAVMNNTGDKLTRTEELFGKANNMVLLVPKGDIVKEKALGDELAAKSYISSVISYTSTVGTAIAQEFIPQDKLSSLLSDNYSRMIITVNTSQESQISFDAVEEIRSLGEKYYGDAYYLSGGSTNVYDMKETITKDNVLVTIVAIVGIGLVLLLTFRSLSLPLILLIVIESSIWINLAFPYFKDQKMAYLGYMIISSLQLGATVDYAILFASRYIENRRNTPKRKAAVQTISDTSASILTSAGILTISGFVMGIISTNGVIAQLGTLIGRGTLLSALMVLLFLPTVLIIFDKAIQKTTLKLDFYKGE